jgi:spore maturation protein CgeB
VGFDKGWYDRRPKRAGCPEIVFAANNYGIFQLSEYRAQVAMALAKKFGSRFAMYGSGWDKYKIKTRRINNSQEADAYNNCKIAISVSNFRFKRYYSDRLLRIMACDAFPLSHDFEEMELDFTEGHDIVTFKNIPDLIEKCDYYLSHSEERRLIAYNAYQNAHSKCTWENRCEELIELLKKYETCAEPAQLIA